MPAWLDLDPPHADYTRRGTHATTHFLSTLSCRRSEYSRRRSALNLEFLHRRKFLAGTFTMLLIGLNKARLCPNSPIRPVLTELQGLSGMRRGYRA